MSMSNVPGDPAYVGPKPSSQPVKPLLKTFVISFPLNNGVQPVTIKAERFVPDSVDPGVVLFYNGSPSDENTLELVASLYAPHYVVKESGQ